MPQLLFSYDGQIGVRQFWFGLLGGLATTIALAVVVGLVLGIAFIVSGASIQTQELVTTAGGLLVAGYAVFTQLAVTVKRCKDRGRSGWCALLTLIPFVGLVWLVVDLGLQRGASDKAAV